MSLADRVSTLRLGAYAVFLGILMSLPLFLDVFDLNRLATMLSYGMAAVAISICWGYGGILNLGQAAFFGLGAYAVAMSLTLAALGPGQEVPSFMIASAPAGAPQELGAILPGTAIWIPFHNIWFGLAMGILAPIALALAIGVPMFYRRLTGVYVAIIMLAVVIGLNLMFVSYQTITGGLNGLGSLAPLTLLGVEFGPYTVKAYYLMVGLIAVVLLGGRWLISSRAGLVLQAIQSDETRVRYLGYYVERYKLFFFVLSAGIAGVAGMMYVIIAQFASPTLMAVTFSVSMVIWAAVGGRGSLLGACIGGIAVSYLEAGASESAMFQPVWPMILGAVFILVVMFLPGGVSGWMDRKAVELLSRPVRRTARGKVGQQAAE